VVIGTPPADLPFGKETRYPFYRGLRGSGRVRENSPHRESIPRTVWPVASRCNDYTFRIRGVFQLTYYIVHLTTLLAVEFRVASNGTLTFYIEILINCYMILAIILKLLPRAKKCLFYSVFNAFKVYAAPRRPACTVHRGRR
jgi:hypothetical protein